MRIFLAAMVGLFSCIAMSPYYDKDAKYVVDGDCPPKSQLNVDVAKDRIETYLDVGKKPTRQRPKYEEIN
ncbi:MAG: hypothetical protein LBQ34_04400 [Alphaproteobacteria bacterium]|jgi:hypothetical protein|nr:hypothetical protein [Alphaproteobacteria bacterium]